MGWIEAMRVPRGRRGDVSIDRLGAGLDGVRVVLLTDTHYGPIDRSRWSERVAAEAVDWGQRDLRVDEADGHEPGRQFCVHAR